MYALAFSNPIEVIKRPCNTAILRFKDEATAYGYNYLSFPNFYQQVRLGINIREFKFPTKQSIYAQQNGRFRKNNVVIYKTRELYSEPLDEPTAEALHVALNHSEVYIDSQEYSMQGEPDITPTEVDNMANFKATLHLQEHQYTNISCQ
jgi:hypothetical protein